MHFNLPNLPSFPVMQNSAARGAAARGVAARNFAERNSVLKGRGSSQNPTGRFEPVEKIPDIETLAEEELPKPETRVVKEKARSIISFNESPDLGFSATLNPYRGCEHGCIYCFARPTHEYLGLSAGLDFETTLFAKENAPALLRKTLSEKSWEPQTIGLSGITDCYQPLERKMKLTRQCLKILAEFRNPVFIVTKNQLVTRDIDLLQELAQHQAVSVFISITTLDKKLARVMEPRASRPDLRLAAIESLAKANIPVGVMAAPIIPGLNDHEIPAILQAASEAGATSTAFTMLRLPYGMKDLFQTWLAEHYPLRAQKVLNHIRDMRGGELNNAEFGERMRGEGEYAAHIAQMFDKTRERYGLNNRFQLSAGAFENPNAQYSLF